MAEPYNKYRCNKCNHEWKLKPYVTGHKCPNCGEENSVAFLGTEYE